MKKLCLNTGTNKKTKIAISNLNHQTTNEMRHFKLQDTLIFMGGGKDNIPVEHWLIKIHGKIKIDADLIDMPMRYIVYVINCVDGMVFNHLEPCSQTNTTKPWKNLDKMLVYLKCCVWQS